MGGDGKPQTRGSSAFTEVGGSLHDREMVLRLLAREEALHRAREMKEDSAVVRVRAVRELERNVTLSEDDRRRGQPHDPTGTVRGVPRDAGRRAEADNVRAADDHDDRYMPKRAPRSCERVAHRLMTRTDVESWLVTWLSSLCFFREIADVWKR